MKWERILQQPQAKYPTETFVRYVARNFYTVTDRSKIKFLDLGCGAGANTKFLRSERFTVTAIDNAKNAAADIFADIRTWDYPWMEFDCVLDNNTLCHIEEPPITNIWSSLKLGGRFYSICPTSETWRGHLQGKGFCRCATKTELDNLYSKFSKRMIGRASYPDKGHQISSWIVEAMK